MEENKTLEILKTIALVEHELKVILPEFYIEYLLEYPRNLEKSIINLGRGNQRLSEVFLINNAYNLLELNNELRAQEDWPKYFFAIGWNGANHYYLIDLRALTKEVFCYESDFTPNETFSNFYVYTENLEEFRRMIIAETGEFLRKNIID